MDVPTLEPDHRPERFERRSTTRNPRSYHRPSQPLALGLTGSARIRAPSAPRLRTDGGSTATHGVPHHGQAGNKAETADKRRRLQRVKLPCKDIVVTRQGQYD